jgi:hypothetical protein
MASLGTGAEGVPGRRNDSMVFSSRCIPAKRRIPQEFLDVRKTISIAGAELQSQIMMPANGISYASGRASMRIARKSLTLVLVGPVIRSSPSAEKKAVAVVVTDPTYASDLKQQP